MPYIGTSPSNGVRRVFSYTASGGQTTFSGASNEGASLAYADTTYIDVYQNGVLLDKSDYTSTSGTSVVLDTGASASDVVVIIVYDVFSAADTVSKKDGGTFDGNVTMGGTLTVTGATTFNGAATFNGTVSGVGLEVLSSDTTGATTSALEIDLSTSTDYAYQMLVLRGFCSSANNPDMYMQLRKQSDSSYLTSSYLSVIGSHFQNASGNSSSQNGLWNGSYFRMVHNAVSSDATHQLNDMKIYFFNTTTDKKAVVGADRFGQNSSGLVKEQMAGKTGDTSVNDRVKLYLSSDNLVYDEYTLYGFRKS